MKDHITKRLVDATKPAPSGRVKVYDETLAGFGFIVQPTGKKSFFIEYGPSTKRQRMTLGAYGPLTAEAARELARVKLGEVAKGADPLAEKAARRAMPTFGGWCDEYLDGVRRRKKQPREDERFLAPRDEPKKHGRKRAEGEPKHAAAVIAARLRPRPLDKITRRDIESAMAELAAFVAEKQGSPGHTSANRWLAAVRACFAAAVRAGLISTNPALGIGQYREAPPRARVLSDDEMGAVIEHVARLDPFERLAFVMLMDTGARKSEVLRARWEDFDLDGASWRIPAPKTGRPQMIPLADDVVTFLRGTERVGPWLVPGRDPAKHRADLRGPWDLIREAAGISDVRIHDLRRTFGLRVARTSGMHFASKLLRHSNMGVTERVYAPFGFEETRAAAEAMLRERGKVIELRRQEAK